MKTRTVIPIIICIIIGVFMTISFSLDDPFNFFELTLPHNEYSRIDYEKLGYDASDNDFKQKLDSKNIQYTLNDVILITGISLTSYPPITNYCGYVIADDGNDYWYESTFQKDVLSQNKITEENPRPCKPNMESCICSLEIKLAEKYSDKLSYFNSTEQAFVEDTVQNYLGSINMASGPEKFIIGKYNHKFEENDIAFCGTFISELVKDPDPAKVLRENVTQQGYFQGTIRDETVLGFQTTVDSEKLCTINKNGTIIHFQRININE